MSELLGSNPLYTIFGDIHAVAISYAILLFGIMLFACAQRRLTMAIALLLIMILTATAGGDMAITSGDLSFMPTVTALMFCQASLGFIYSIFAAWEHKTTNRTTLATLTIILIALTHMTLSATFATNLMTDYVSYFDETRSIWVTIEGYSAGASFVLIVALIVVILIRFIGKHFRWNTHTASFVSHFGQTRNSSSEPQWPGTAPFATRN